MRTCKGKDRERDFLSFNLSIKHCKKSLILTGNDIRCSGYAKSCMKCLFDLI